MEPGENIPIESGEDQSVPEEIVDASSQTPGNDLLVAEFNYIAESAFQANEDRARVSQFFFITFGTFVAAIFSSQLQNVNIGQMFFAFSLVFFINAILGMLTILQLTRLRLAWRESALAMNQMKDRWIETRPDLEPYFRWTTRTIPPAFKVNSVAFYLALMVALLSGLAFGAGIAFYSLSRDSATVPWPYVISLGVLTTLIFLAMYWLSLRRSD